MVQGINLRERGRNVGLVVVSNDSDFRYGAGLRVAASNPENNCRHEIQGHE